VGILHDLAIGPIRVVFSDRADGVGRDHFESANLSMRVGDSESVVEENRRRLSRDLGVETDWFEVRQVHGSDVVAVDETGALASADTAVSESNSIPRADAAVAAAPTKPLSIFTADCIPLALLSVDPPGIAVVHAGWKGLVAGVVQNAARALVEKTGAIQWVVAGPSIGPCCYRVDDGRMRLFSDRFGAQAVDTARHSLNLHAAAAEALRSCQLLPDVFLSLGPCTSCSSRLFSFRRDGPVTGRQVMLAWIEGPARGIP
jgi:YfiH family protein